MMTRLLPLLTASAVALALSVGVADAQAVKKARVAHVAKPVKSYVIAEISDATYLRPLTVKKRSFLDPGNVVPVGSATPEYIVANTSEHIPVYRSYNTAFFGESELPGRFDLPPTNPRYNPDTEPRIPFSLVE